MAIVTISQIKHRRGQKGVDPMPQMASAELGWAVDTQQLYIGNGTIVEGAPAIGNTEILTQHSDLTLLLTDYTYEGPFVGASVNTGPGPSNPIVRSQDETNDDTVNVRMFGATGDGVTDDLAALRRAIWEHTLEQPSNNRYWTTIYMPAGTYRITAPLQLPSHVRLVGDGPQSTVISMDSGNASVLEIEKMIDPNTTLDVYPTGILVEKISFVATQTASHVCTLGDASWILFDLCTFTGAAPDTTVLGTNKACVLFSNQDNPSNNIKFINCRFEQAQYGIASDIPDVALTRQDVMDVVIENCVFSNLYKGITVGQETNSPTNEFPHAWRVSFSLFDNIAREGIHCFQTNKFTSSMNHFSDVGNNQLGANTGNATYSNIVLGDSGGVNPINPGAVDLSEYEGNYSIGDTFDRDDVEDDISRRILSENCLSSYIIDPFQIHYGSSHQEPGRLIRLIGNTVVATPTGISFDADEYEGVIIDYQINRGDDIRRTGTFVLTLGQTVHSLTEDFVELTTPFGVIFTTDQTGSVTDIEYTLNTVNGNDGVLSYDIRHLTCKAAVPPST